MCLDQWLPALGAGFFEGLDQSAGVIERDQRVQELILAALPDAQILENQRRILSDLELQAFLNIFLEFWGEGKRRVHILGESFRQVVQLVDA